MEIKVSIVIPVYKVEKYIERCLRSVFNQTYVNIECIIVNDCTPDNSFIIAKELVKSYQGSVDFQFVEHEKTRDCQKLEILVLRWQLDIIIFLGQR